MATLEGFVAQTARKGQPGVAAGVSSQRNVDRGDGVAVADGHLAVCPGAIHGDLPDLTRLAPFMAKLGLSLRLEI